jgi:hypothetical protein
MGRKGKTQTHTAKELAGKAAAAKHAAGGAGGGGGAAEKRKAAGTKVAVFCEICKSIQPNMKSMEAHYDSKHAKEPWATIGPKYDAQFNANRQGLKTADPTFKEKKTPAERAKDKEERERKKREAAEAKLNALKGGNAAKATAAGGGDDKLKALEKEMMPLVKKGDGLQDAGDLDGALALYQEAMDGFRTNGFKRPKLKEKLDAVKAKIAAAPEPAVDQSVEVDASVEVDEEC